MNSPIGWAAPSARFEFASDFPTPAASNSFAAHGLEIPPDTGISNFATLFALDASPNPSSTPPAQVHGLYRHARRHLPSRDMSIALGWVLVGGRARSILSFMQPPSHSSPSMALRPVCTCWRRPHAPRSALHRRIPRSDSTASPTLPDVRSTSDRSWVDTASRRVQERSFADPRR